MLLLSVLLAAAALLPPTWAQNIPPEQLFHLRSLEGALAVCNDGSQAMFMYRNCSANWDRKPGDPDYCDLPVIRWVVVFASEAIDFFGGVGATRRPNPPHTKGLGKSPLSGPYCYSDTSCASRSSNLTTSRGLPSTAFPGGVAVPYAEANPNLYKSHHVVVPYCSSDLWAGNSSASFQNGQTWHFRGAQILTEVIETLFTLDGGGRAGLAGADEVLLVGPAGVLAQAGPIAEYMLSRKRAITGNATAALDISLLCDGCALIADLQPLPGAKPACTTDANCPPSIALPNAQALWGLEKPAWCTESEAWRCLTGSALLSGISTHTSLPLLVQAQQFDAQQLSAYGAWPSAATNGTAAHRWAQATFAPAVRALLQEAQKSAPSTIIFSAACSSPSSLSLDQAYYHISSPCTSTQGYHFTDTLSQSVPAFFVDGPDSPTGELQCQDTCKAIGCNTCGSDFVV